MVLTCSLIGEHAALAPPPRKLLGHAIWTNLDEFSLFDGAEVSVALPPWGAEEQSRLAQANSSPVWGLPTQPG